MHPLPRPSGWFPVLTALVCCFALAGPVRAATEFVYIADLNGKIYRLEVATGAAVQLSLSSVLLNGAVGIVQEDNQDFLVSTVGSDAIQRIGFFTGTITTVTSGNLIKNPDGIARIGSEVFIADNEAFSIIGVNTVTGAQRYVVNGGLSAGGPWLCAGTDGFLYVSRNSNSTIVRVNPTTGAENVVSSGGLLTDIVGIGCGPDGYLYVASFFAQRIIRVNPANGEQSVVAEGNYLNHPFGVGVGPDGYIWVSMDHSNRLVRVHPVSGTQTPYNIGNMSLPYGVLPVGPSSPPPPPPSPLVSCSASEDRADSVIVQWIAGPGQIDFFQLLRDGTTLATVAAPGSRYADKPNSGTHTYCVQAVNVGGISDPCCDSGTLRPPVTSPHLDFVSDVANDQGGKVMLGWAASDLDAPAGSITGYRVWRRLPLSGAATQPLEVSASDNRDARMRTWGGQAAYWEAMATLPSALLPGYGYVAATLQDSLPASNPSTAFFVSALTANPLVFYDSNVDSGYSVDNLAPDVPQGLAGAYLAAGGLKLKWLPSRAADLSLYRVYRGNTASFVPSEINRIGATTDTTFVDPDAAAYFYKLSSVDVHGNEGGFALLKPDDIPVAALVLAFHAEALKEGVRVSIDLVHDMASFGARLWRSETESRFGAVPVFPDALPFQGSHFEVLDSQAPAVRVWYWADLVQGQDFVSSFGPITVLPYGSSPATILLAPEPNPSMGSVEFVYTVGADQAGSGSVPVRIAIYDARGKMVRDVKSTSETAGSYRVPWDGTDQRGATLRSGVFHYRLQVGDRVRVGKVIRL